MLILGTSCCSFAAGRAALQARANGQLKGPLLLLLGCSTSSRLVLPSLLLLFFVFVKNFRSFSRDKPTRKMHYATILTALLAVAAEAAVSSPSTRKCTNPIVRKEW